MLLTSWPQAPVAVEPRISSKSGVSKYPKKKLTRKHSAFKYHWGWHRLYQFTYFMKQLQFHHFQHDCMQFESLHFVANAASHEVLVKSQHETTKNGATWSNKPSKNNSSQYYTAPTSSETVLDHRLFTLKSLKIAAPEAQSFDFVGPANLAFFTGVIWYNSTY